MLKKNISLSVCLYTERALLTEHPYNWIPNKIFADKINNVIYSFYTNVFKQTVFNTFFVF